MALDYTRIKKMRKHGEKINRKALERFMEAGASKNFLVKVFGENTLKAHCKKVYGLSIEDTIQKFESQGKMNILLSQYELATVDRNAVMLIWVGKQRLGQTDDPLKNKINEEKNEVIKGLIDAVKGVK